MTDTLEDLFLTGLKEAYYTEQQLVDVLDELADQTSNEKIADAFSEHREETQQHVEILEDVFDTVGESPEAKEAGGLEGLLREHEEFEDTDPSQEVRDRFHVMAGQKTEHYEIATYGNLTPLADEVGYDDVADRLEQILREEEEALDELSQLGEQFDEGQLAQSS